MTRAAVGPRLLGLAAAGAACLPASYWLPGDPGGATAATTTTTADPPPPDTCLNGQLDPGELDVDCGPECGPCEPGQACGDDGVCEGGICVDGVCLEDPCARGLECPPAPDPCVEATCEPLVGCVEAPAEAGTPCEAPKLGPGICKEGACVQPCGDCSYLDNGCRVGVCEIVSGECAVKWASEGQECLRDGCMIPGVCARGVCTGPQEELTLFASDFADPGPWTVEGPWEIGPAKTSLCGLMTKDPAEDHSPSADEMLAGLVIGGCVPPDGAPPACLTSPPFELPRPLPGLRLRFWEVVDLPPPPLTSLTIEVFDGEQWTVIATSVGPVETWAAREVALDWFWGPVAQVRFCVGLMAGMEAGSGWSLDDVSVGFDGC